MRIEGEKDKIREEKIDEIREDSEEKIREYKRWNKWKEKRTVRGVKW